MNNDSAAVLHLASPAYNCLAISVYWISIAISNIFSDISIRFAMLNFGSPFHIQICQHLTKNVTFVISSRYFRFVDVKNEPCRFSRDQNKYLETGWLSFFFFSFHFVSFYQRLFIHIRSRRAVWMKYMNVGGQPSKAVSIEVQYWLQGLNFFDTATPSV